LAKKVIDVETFFDRAKPLTNQHAHNNRLRLTLDICENAEGVADWTANTDYLES
jgi:hypothetical protein